MRKINPKLKLRAFLLWRSIMCCINSANYSAAARWGIYTGMALAAIALITTIVVTVLAGSGGLDLPPTASPRALLMIGIPVTMILLIITIGFLVAFRKSA